MRPSLQFERLFFGFVVVSFLIVAGLSIAYWHWFPAAIFLPLLVAVLLALRGPKNEPRAHASAQADQINRFGVFLVWLGAFAFAISIGIGMREQASGSDELRAAIFFGASVLLVSLGAYGRMVARLARSDTPSAG